MIQVLIQAAAGSRDRMVHDEGTLQYLETRRVAVPYPYPYGFIIGTRAEDGDCVDCFLITVPGPKAGTIVDCQPAGLLWQDENGQADHKVLAAMPGQEIALDDDLLHELREFVTTIFAAWPEVRVRVGPILPREAALAHLRVASSG
jgi:inorganic pyrophosphatase